MQQEYDSLHYVSPHEYLNLMFDINWIHRYVMKVIILCNGIANIQLKDMPSQII